jgi:hypothetical protein
MEDVVIDATGRFAGDPGRLHRPMHRELPEDVVELPRREWTEEEVRAYFCPTIKMLPFVVMQSDNPLKNATCYWHDEHGSSQRGYEDVKRGRTYAQLFIQAVERDRPTYRSVYAAPRYLEAILTAMVNEALERRRKGGKGSRTTFTGAMTGFMVELTEHICKPSLSSEEVPGS